MGDEGDAQLAGGLASASAAHRRQYQPGHGRRAVSIAEFSRRQARAALAAKPERLPVDLGTTEGLTLGLLA
jgi:hypothetical protein